MRSLPNSMKIPWLLLLISVLVPALSRAAEKYDEFGDPVKAKGDDDGASAFGTTPGTGTGTGTGDGTKGVTVPKTMKTCTGIMVQYNFMGREKTYPLTHNVSGQSWKFKSMLQLLNMGATELKLWQVFVGFQHHELIVSVDGGTLVDAEEYPADVQNGTTISGSGTTDLKTAIDTAGDTEQMSAQVTITGTQFGLGNGKTPMPKTIKLVNDGFKCPAPTKYKTSMQMCCKKDKKFKIKKVKMNDRRNGDLNIAYDVLQAFGNNYQVQVTIDNNNPLGGLSHWNLTWEWMRGEFIYSMKGAYPSVKDPSACIYGAAGQYYGEMDFTQVSSCHKNPIIKDLPREKKDDKMVGKLPYCCRNGSILSKVINATEARAVFQMQVFKLPPDQNRTAIYPPQNWKITGAASPQYACGAPARVSPAEFPDPTGLNSKSLAVASWQIICKITKPKPRKNKCCVSFSSYYNESAVPCDTCACGCNDEDETCSTRAPAMLLPPNVLLVPYDNRTKKAVAWARMKHHKVHNPLPCPDNCGVSVNYHLMADFKGGFTARITLFNWGDEPFENWFAALQMGKAGAGFEKSYSFNGTQLDDKHKTIFLQGFKGMNYLIAETNGSKRSDPRVPGKQQTVISFKKKLHWRLDVPGGDGFPKKIIFNGAECALPRAIPSGAHGRRAGLVPLVIALAVGFIVVG